MAFRPHMARVGRQSSVGSRWQERNFPVKCKSPFVLDEPAQYARWRAWKRASQPRQLEELLIPVEDPYSLQPYEREAIVHRCRQANMAIYQLADPGLASKEAIAALGRQLGLVQLDGNLGADDDRITSLQVVEGDRRTGYIPYTSRALSWHTDGYYNPPHRQIRGIVMHCVRTAAAGGENALMDHEMLYMRLRDEHPELVRALMDPQAMTIPPNLEGGEEIRGAQTGPVFSVDRETGNLHMRYSARMRNIQWKADALTQEAAAMLTRLLAEGEENRYQVCLQPGQGIICNNVLHSRTAFENGQSEGAGRLLYRARYYDRIAGTGVADSNWQVN